MSSANKRFSVLVDHLSVDIIKSLEQFEGLRDEWENLFNSCNNLSVFQSFTWNYGWWKYRGKGLQLSIITVCENNHLVGIGPFMVKSRFGKPQFEPIGGEHHYNFGLVMDSHRADVAAAIALKISECFPKGIVHIPYYSAGTACIDIFMATLNAKGWKESRWTRNISHYVYENNGFISYMSRKSKKSRYNLKRERTRLEETGTINLIHICQDDLTEISVERIAQLQKQSWLSRRGQESLDSPFYKEVIPALAQKNKSEIFIYTQNGEDIAYILNLYSGNTCYCFFVGFSETRADLSPGKQLMMDNLQKVLDRGTTVYDFLYGDGEYKRFWANRTKYIYRAVSYKGYQGWLTSWFPHRLHGQFAKYDKLRKLVGKLKKAKIRYIGYLNRKLKQKDEITK
jgi:CelD/BcsL family acetyltransferase involved in cellulose biosynthesis